MYLSYAVDVKLTHTHTHTQHSDRMTKRKRQRKMEEIVYIHLMNICCNLYSSLKLQ